jgi:hypothetical protein
MKKLAVILLMVSQPVLAQVKLVPKDVSKRVDSCAPIGRTEDGKLVYPMKCETLPARPTPAVAPQAQANPASSPEAPPRSDAETETTTERSGLFGMSFDRRPK